MTTDKNDIGGNYLKRVCVPDNEMTQVECVRVALEPINNMNCNWLVTHLVFIIQCRCPWSGNCLT